MPVLVVLLAVPPILLVGGAYLLRYPLSLAALYGLNVALMDVVLWAVGNQVVKIQSQRMSISGPFLRLTRKQLAGSWPLVSQSEIEIPLEDLEDFKLRQTRLGYLLTVIFRQDGKRLGLDLDLNPLRPANGEILRRVLAHLPEAGADEKTAEILQEYPRKVFFWKSQFIFSIILIVAAVAVFFAVSVFLGIGSQK